MNHPEVVQSRGKGNALVKAPMLTNPSFPGETYQLSDSIFPRADESSVAHTGGSNLTVNLRRDVTECEICPLKVCISRNCVLIFFIII